MENQLADTILKSWTEAIIEERKALSKVATDCINNGNTSRVETICHPQLKYIDSVLMKIYLLAKSESDIPEDVIAKMHKEIFNQIEKK